MKKLTRYILSRFGGNAITKDEIRETCKRFGADVDNTINFMISYGYLVRILRGLYYVKTVEEFELKKSPDIYKILSLGLNKLKVKWYFGLYTSLRLNGLTHEFFDTIFILNDRIYRPKEIKVGGEKVKFIKLSSKLVDFGIVNESGKRFSDVEKTLLDLAYISRYRSVPEGRITSMIEEYRKRVKADKVMEYLKFYPKSVEKVAMDAGLV
jgi:predicted transcriptional regulator of viral defense system